MEEKQKIRFILVFIAVYMIVFAVIAAMRWNYEFLYYTMFLTAAIIILAHYYKRLNVTPGLMAGLALLGLMHVAGGNIYFDGMRLYDVRFIGILGYDSVMHAFGAFMAAFVGYNIFYPHLDEKIKNNKILLGLLVVLVAMGVGAANEIIEFGAVVFLGAEKQVGDYLNNALDLVFNLAGAVTACICIFCCRKK